MNKLFAIAALAAVVVSTPAFAGSVQFDALNISPSPTGAKTDDFKVTYTDTLVGNFGYSIEASATHAGTTGYVKDAQLLEQLNVVIPNGPFTGTVSAIYGQERTTTKYASLYGLEGRVTSKTPVDNLTVSVGYRYLDGVNVAGFKANRVEASTEYDLTKKYAVGAEYFSTTGYSKNNQVGAFVKVKF